MTIHPRLHSSRYTDPSLFSRLTLCSLRRSCILLAFLLSGAAAQTSEAQTVSGYVEDACTQTKLEGADITVVGLEDAGVIAGDDGIYSIDLSPGAYTLRAAFDEYRTKDLEIVVPVEGTAERNFGLFRSGYCLTVTQTEPDEEGDDVNTLQAAISMANEVEGEDLIDFNISALTDENGPYTLPISGALPIITDPVVIDGVTEPGAMCGSSIPERSLQIIVSGAGSESENGIVLGEGSDGSTIRGLVINGFEGSGILINGSDSNTIECNIVGTNVLGDEAAPNGTGILITSGTGNIIGGMARGSGNLVSGNGADGVHFEPDADGNVVQGNFIGTDLSGTSRLGNSSVGVGINGGSGNTVGGSEVIARNVISGNDRYGVELAGFGAAENVVEGNFIGLDLSGNIALGNTIGVLIQGGASANQIGGLDEWSRNVISANSVSGVELHGTSTSDNLIRGNYIGTDSIGAESVGTQGAGVVIGEFFENPDEPDPLPSDNTVGGAVEGARNLISGNSGPGVLIRARADGNLIAGNWIGLNANGDGMLPNTEDGVRIFGASNTVGVSNEFEAIIGEGNVISGNGWDGVYVAGGWAEHNVIGGNRIGTDPEGETELGNGGAGVRIDNAADNSIGGFTAFERNLLSGNDLGISISGLDATNNEVLGNYIGTNAGGTSVLPNANHGIYIDASDNTVGGTSSGARNVISGNGASGVLLIGPGNDNEVLGNSIGTNASGALALPNQIGVQVLNSNLNNIGGPGDGESNIISGNDQEGILILGGPSQDNLIRSNLIGLAADRSTPLGNSNGIRIDAAPETGFPSNNTIGGTGLDEGNVLAHNDLTGVAAFGGSGNSILSNSIHSNGLLGIDLGETDEGSDGVTNNDPDDSDTGANSFQNFPNLTQPVEGDGIVVVTGTLLSSANETFRVEFFANETCDPSGHGEGTTFLGFEEVTTEADGSAEVSFSFNPNGFEASYVTATATDESNNTSEFSTCGLPDLAVPDGYLVDVYAYGFEHPQGIATDGNGNLLVIDGGTAEVWSVSPTGGRTLLADGFSEPVDLAVVGNTVYVTDFALEGIYDFSIPEDVVYNVNPLDQFAALVRPTHIDVGPDSDLYVSVAGDAEESSLVRVDPSNGDIESVFDFSVNSEPQGLAVLDDELYVADRHDNTVKRTLLTGSPGDADLPAVLTDLDGPSGLGVGLGDRLYVATRNEVVRALPGATTWDSFLTGLSGSDSNGLYITDRGTMYVSDTDGGRIIRVSAPRQQRLSEDEFTFVINENGLPAVTDGSDLIAFQNAAQNWNGVSTSTANLTYDGTTSTSEASASDGENVITASDSDYLFSPFVLAVAAKLIVFGDDDETGEIIDWDIVINPAFSSQITTSGSESEFDAEAIVTHEFGHVLGLTHSPVPWATMFWAIPPGPDFRTLSLDDAAWVSQFYPTPVFESNPSGISGVVTDGNSVGDPIAGAFIIAIDENVETDAVHAYTDVDGSYFIPGLPSGNYLALLGAIDGDVWGTNMMPGNVNLRTHLIAQVTDFPVEYYNGSNEVANPEIDNPSDFELITVSSVATDVDFITNQDLTPPTITVISPEDGATNVAGNSPIVINFSEPVDAESVEGAFTLSDASPPTIDGTFTFIDDDQTAVFLPDASLISGVEYTFTLDPGVEDKHANAMEDGISATFVVDDSAPSVTQITPADDADDVFITSKITIVFSKAIDPSTLVARTDEDPDAGFLLRRPGSDDANSPILVPGTFTFSLGNTVATFTPDENPPSGLLEATTYAVDINIDSPASPVTDASGNSVEQFSSSFSTVLEAVPEVVEAGPSPDAVTGITVETALYVDFSEPINTALVSTLSVSLVPDGATDPAAGTFEFLNDDSRVVFRPANPLDYGTLHTLTVTTDIEDKVGNGMTDPFSRTFTTTAIPSAPDISAVTPPSGTVGSTVTISGAGFDPDASANSVLFNTTSADVASSTLSRIVTTVPEGATTGFVTANGATSDFPFAIVDLLDLEDAATARVSSTAKPNDAEIMPDGGTAWIVSTGEEEAFSLDLTTLELGPSVVLGDQPLRIAITPDGQRAYVTNYGSHNLTMINITDPTLTTETAPTGLNPVDVAISPDGATIYVSEETSQGITVLGGDPTSGVFNQATARITTNAANSEIKVSPDGGLLLVAGSLGITIVELDPISPSNSAVARVSSNAKTTDVSISPDGGTAVAVTDDGGLLIIQIDPVNPLASSAVARVSSTAKASSVEFSPDGATFYVTSYEDGTITAYEIMDLAAGEIGAKSGTQDPKSSQQVQVVPVGDPVEIDPCAQSLALNPTSQTIVTTNACEDQGEGSIWVITFDLSPEQLFELLFERLDELAESGKIHKGTMNSLLASLRNAQKHYERGRESPALNNLEAFIKKAQSSLKSGRLDPETAADLMDLAERIVDKLEGNSKGGLAEGEDFDEQDLPTEFALQPNYPNPFNPTTTIEYSIPGGLEGPVHVRLEVFNILGQRVAVLVNEEQSAGRHQAVWNGRISDGAEAASGVYLFRIAMGDYQSVKKMTLLR